jgi:hypothetical protein
LRFVGAGGLSDATTPRVFLAVATDGVAFGFRLLLRLLLCSLSSQRDQYGLLAFNSAGFHTTFTTSAPQSAVLPGKFKVCASNPSLTNNTRISLSLVTN